MKVLIGVGTCNKFSYCEKQVFDNIFSQTYPADVLIVDNSIKQNYSTTLKINYPLAKVIHLKRPGFFRDAVGQVRKYIMDYAVANEYDYLFFVDADFILKPNDLEKLISHKKDFVTGVIGYLHDRFNRTTVYIKHPDPQRIGKLPGQPALFPLSYFEMDEEPEFMEIISCGLSCCLISTRVLIGMNFYISHREKAFLEDRVFCRDLTQKGIKLYLDKRVRPIHLHVMMEERNFRRIS